MFKHYIKITWREFAKDSLYTWIKIGGFALGIAACLLITLYTKHELSYDKQYKNTERIYRVVRNFKDQDGLIKGVHFQAPFAQALMDEFPEIEKAGRFNAVELFGAGSNQVRTTEALENSYEEGFVYADQEILDILEVPFVYGDPKNALTEANSIVITKSKANKFFSDENPVGKQMIVSNDIDNPYTVSGVIEDFPNNSHINFDFLIALHPNIFYKGEQTKWTAWNYPTYVLLKPGTNIKELEEKLKLISQKYMSPAFERYGHELAEEIKSKYSYKLQPIKDIYLKSADIRLDGFKNGDIRFVRLFGAIALFILIIAGINFVNLSTARSTNRAKEVGLRKTIGARKKYIINQFFFESIAYSIISVAAGILIASLILPVFNNLADKSLVMPLGKWFFVPVLFTAALIIGFAAGAYPSFYLSSFKPIKVMKGNFSGGKSKSLLRNGLVVFQFTTSIILSVSTIVVNNQLNFILNKKLGFQKDQVVLLHGTNTLENNITPFKNELLKISTVENVSISDYLPIKGTRRNGNSFWKEGRTNIDKSIGGQRWRVDYDYLETLGMKLVDGRNFSEAISTDRNAAIINEMMAKELGFENPVGKRITNGGATWEIIGVIEDFHYESIKYDIQPLVMNLGNSPQTMTIKIQSSDVGNTIKEIQNRWKEFSPNQAFRYSFLNSDFAMMYSDIQRLGKIFFVFAILAILIACLGLFGLAEYITKGRIKEIGVRKVNGARISNILGILNKDFITWVFLSFIIASPIAWYAINRYLQNFAYKIEVGWWVFIAAGSATLIIAILTVSWQSFRAAARNPVEALRYE